MSMLNQNEVAKRWHISPRTLEQWRWLGNGPRYVKIGARVLYPESEIEAFEHGNLHQNTSAPLPQEGI